MSRSYQLGALLSGVCATLVGLLLYMYGRPAVRGISAKNLNNGTQLATACQLYAADHGGRFPMSLGEVQPKYLEAKAFQEMRYQVIRDRKATGVYVDWLYFGAGFDESNTPKVLIASPQVIGTDDQPERIFIQGDTEGRVGPESDFEKLLTATIRQMRALDTTRHGEATAPPPSPAAAQ